MAPEVLLGFTIQIKSPNEMFPCIYNHFETRINLQLDEQMFVYFLLAAVTLQAGIAQCGGPILRE